MTHQDAENERIAAYFEEKPARITEEQRSALFYHREISKSPKGFWYFDGKWKPLNFLTDETASAILRDAMLAAGWSIWLFDDHYRLYRNDADSGPVQVSEGFADNARLAIVECFKWMQAKGGRG